jgi:hypothetical protein
MKDKREVKRKAYQKPELDSKGDLSCIVQGGSGDGADTSGYNPRFP